MKKFIYILIAFTIILGFYTTKSNYYPIADVSDNKIMVIRKGCVTVLYTLENVAVGDSIKLYGDYDWHWKPLSICD